MSPDPDDPQQPDGGGSPAAWLLILAGSLPAAWEHRAHDCKFVPLLPSEADSVLESGSTHVQADVEDMRLIRLVAAGRTVDEIANELRLHPRTVQRRIARLRERFSVDTKAQLATVLARRGFGDETPRRDP